MIFIKIQDYCNLLNNHLHLEHANSNTLLIQILFLLKLELKISLLQIIISQGMILSLNL